MKNLKTLLYGLSLFLIPTLHAQENWTLQNPATKPSRRSYHAMASLGGDQVLLFGGLHGDDATWV